MVLVDRIIIVITKLDVMTNNNLLITQQRIILPKKIKFITILLDSNVVETTKQLLRN